jgi:hypothetical protein
MNRTAVTLAFGLAAAGCGGLGNPDLSVGAVGGRLAGASANAYVYPLGRPDLRVYPGADGAWALERLPVGRVEIVLVDGAPGAWRAERVAAEVAAGDRGEVADRDSATLAPAGRVAAVARFGGACESSALTFTLVGTDQQDVAPPATGTAALLERVPAGSYQLAGRSGGFTDATVDVAVGSGQTVAYELSLGLATATITSTPGCTADAAGCRIGLVCDAADGACYECVHDSDCTTPRTCANHVCHDPAIAGETCDPCTSDAGCELTVSSVCSTGAFCTHLCALDADCPAGFACVLDGARKVCKAPQGCAEAREEFGGECFFDTGCSDALHNGVCFGARPGAEPPLPGYCTGACKTTDDCDLAPGFVCGTNGLCVRSTGI